MIKRILNRMISKGMGAFVAHGVSIDDDGRLCLPDGLTPRRVHRFIELTLDRSYACPRDAMHDLYGHVGVPESTIRALNGIVGEQGDLDMGAIARHWTSLAGELPHFHAIPTRFQDFLVKDLAMADPDSRSLGAAVESTRRNMAERVGCAPTWDEILEHPVEVAAIAASWRERAGLA